MLFRSMMMPLLISGPKQPGNDIDVYLAPLFEDLIKLWEEGVEVFDAYRQEKITLRVMVMFKLMIFQLYQISRVKRRRERRHVPCVVRKLVRYGCPTIRRMLIWGIAGSFLGATATGE